MAKALSNDLRQRVIDGIDRGLSCRQAAERFGVSASSASRWLDRLKMQGGAAANRQGGGRKPGRIEAEAAFLLAAARMTSIACPAVQKGGAVTNVVCMSRPIAPFSS
jgi:transposase